MRVPFPRLSFRSRAPRRPARRAAAALLVALLGTAAAAPALAAGEVEWTRLPPSLRLFPRDDADSCAVAVEGTVTAGAFDSVSALVLRDGVPFARRAAALTPGPGGAPFALSLPLHAELAEYGLRVYLDTLLVAERESLLCGDAILINGQSNAVAHDYGGVVTDRCEWVRSFGTTEDDSAACAADTAWGLAQGHERYAPRAVGVWGLRLGERIAFAVGVPVCVLNGAVGDTPIQVHLRKTPPLERLSSIYGRLYFRTVRAGLAGAVRTLLWYQGESNTSSSLSSYPGYFAELRAAWAEDFPALEKVYVFQIRPGCGGNYQSRVRDELRRLPEAHAGVVALSTAGLPGFDGCHFDSSGYGRLAAQASRAVLRDLYGSADSAGARPPAPVEARFTGPSRDAVDLRFDQPVLWPADTLGASMIDYFYLNGSSGAVAGAAETGDPAVIRLLLAGTSAADSLTYLPNCCYAGTAWAYRGPWIRNDHGVGAFSFYNLRIKGPLATGTGAGAPPAAAALRLDTAPNPFNPSTTVRMVLPRAGRTRLTAYDALGRRAAVLFDGEAEAGPLVRRWDAGDLPSGVYFLLLEGEGGRTARKAILLR